MYSNVEDGKDSHLRDAVGPLESPLLYLLQLVPAQVQALQAGDPDRHTTTTMRPNLGNKNHPATGLKVQP